MPLPYLCRTPEPTLREAAAEFPAVVLTGPRQSGKTTLLKHPFGDTHRYLGEHVVPKDALEVLAEQGISFTVKEN